MQVPTTEANVLGDRRFQAPVPSRPKPPMTTRGTTAISVPVSARPSPGRRRVLRVTRQARAGGGARQTAVLHLVAPGTCCVSSPPLPK